MFTKRTSLTAHSPAGHWVTVTASGLLCVLIAITCSGCGQQGEPPASTVAGTVTFKGQPVTGGTLTFHIKDGNGKSLPFAGELDTEGNYELTNAVPGMATITVETATQKGLPNFFPLPDKFAKPAASGLTFEITLGHQEHNIELE